MKYFSRNNILIALIVGICVFTPPISARALCITPTGCASDAAAAVTQTVAKSVSDSLTLTINSSILFIQSLLLWLIVQLGSMLSWVLKLDVSVGGVIVYSVWKILRDFCNMAFIVVLILTSFGTIFSTLEIGFLSAYKISNKKLIWGFLSAALFMNFSLAIGQTVVAFTNNITSIVLKVLPADPGAQVAQALQLAAIAAGGLPQSFTPTNTAATTFGTQPNKALSADDMRAINTKWETAIFRGYLSCVNIPGNAVFDFETKACLYGVPGLGGYGGQLKVFGAIPYSQVATGRQSQLQNQTFPPPAIAKDATGTYVYKDASLVALVPSVPPAASTGTTALKDTLSRVMSGAYAIFLLMVMLMSFVVVVVFMLIRIPAIWFILVLSPLPWVSLMFPGSTLWKKWWEQFMGWNIFSPLYLLMIYFGLYMLEQQGALLGDLGKTGSFTGSQVGILLFYLMTGFIFIGGTAAVASVAFKSGTLASNTFQGITSSLGFKKGTGAIGAVYDRIGLESRVKGVQQGIQAQYNRRILEPRKNTNEDITARYQALFGDKSALENLKRKRITEQFNKNKEKGLSTQDLQKDFEDIAKGSAKSLAAAAALLENGKLNAEEMLKYQKAANQVSSSYASAVREKVENKLKDTGKEKQFKYKDEGEIVSALEQYAADPTKPADDEGEKAKTKMREGIIKKIEQTQPILAAQIAVKINDNKMFVNADGTAQTDQQKKQAEVIKKAFQNPNGTQKTAVQIIEGNFKGLDNKGLLDLIDKTTKRDKDGKPDERGTAEFERTETMNKLLGERLKKLEAFSSLINSATPEQQKELNGIAALRSKVDDARKKGQKKPKKNKKSNP